jgi:hypothetical protein
MPKDVVDTTEATVAFGQLPELIQDLVASTAMLIAMLERKDATPERLRAVADLITAPVDEILPIVAGLVGVAVDQRQRIRELEDQLEKIGRKAFWARGRPARP